MTKLIDADMLIAYVKKYGFYCDTEADKEATIKEIEMLPTMEIVLCMDCKRQKTCKFAQWQGNYGYCSNGERGEK